MQIKKVSRIDEPFSVVGFGCWASGGEWNDTNDLDSMKAMQRAVDLGVNFFDVAPVYGLGHAEEVLGEALKGRRQQVMIGSKCGLLWDDRGRISNNLTAESMHVEIDDSLRRFQTDYIDLYQLHWPDLDTPIEETISALEQIRHMGKIRYYGVSNFSLSLTFKAMELGHVASYQGLYNMLERNPDSYHSIPLDYRTEREILPLCEDYGLAFLPYSPLFQGLLADSFQASDNFDEHDIRSNNPKLRGELFQNYFEKRKRLDSFAQQIGKPLHQVAINWLIAHPAVTSIICGAQTAEQVQQNIESVSWQLSEDMLTEIDTILQSLH
ncbi:MAG: aldo/keto reductase [Chloroflexi bacterium]|nr:aldo/keto reductase [Chloroflexota bacterium]